MKDYIVTDSNIKKVQEQFKDVLLDGGSISDLLQILSESIDVDIALICTKMNNRYFSNPSGKLNKLIMDKSIEEIISRYFNYEIAHNNNTYANIIVNNLDKQLTEFERLLISLSELPVLLLLQKQSEEFLIEKKYRNEFIQDIVFNRINSLEKAEEKASFYGWNFTNMTSISVFVISLINEGNMDYDVLKNLELFCKEFIRKEYPESIYTIIGNKIVFIVSGVDNENLYNSLLEGLLKELKKLDNQRILIGVGSKKSGILMTHKSYNEAITALKIGMKISENEIVFYNRLGVYKLLASVHNSLLAEDFLLTYLNPLIKYDKENCQDLLNTLNALVENDWDIKRVSDEQYIHYNTVKYRIKKVADILDLDLSISDNKINIALALKLYHLKG